MRLEKKSDRQYLDVVEILMRDVKEEREFIGDPRLTCRDTAAALIALTLKLFSFITFDAASKTFAEGALDPRCLRRRRVLHLFKCNDDSGEDGIFGRADRPRDLRLELGLWTAWCLACERP